MEEKGARVERLLLEHGIRIESGSCLERMTTGLWSLQEEVGTTLHEVADLRSRLADVCALHELTAQLLAVCRHPSFSSLIPHLRLLNTGEAAQNRPTAVTDAAANKIFELLAACFAMQIAEAVELDDPEGASGENPDVMAKIESKWFGFACKVPHTKNPKTFLERLREGVGQIERSRCDTGVVFFSLRNVLDHSRYWTMPSDDHDDPLPDRYTLLKWAEEETELLAKRVQRHCGSETFLEKTFAGMKAARCAVFYTHVFAGPSVRDLHAPAMIRFPSVIRMGELEPTTEELLRSLNGVVGRD